MIILFIVNTCIYSDQAQQTVNISHSLMGKEASSN